MAPRNPDRLRTPANKKMVTMEDISATFHMPIKQAAIHLKVCTTVIKKHCREYGIKRWPFRKILSVQKKINDVPTNIFALGGNGDSIVQNGHHAMLTASDLSRIFPTRESVTPTSFSTDESDVLRSVSNLGTTLLPRYAPRHSIVDRLSWRPSSGSVCLDPGSEMDSEELRLLCCRFHLWSRGPRIGQQ
eukprot:TRINITY_DN11785_c0_g1_i1.p1 TRINITY_DN11785_c0_g1~~TRINITY_DN11785_c0_g1_i1.p1  ORF type:complete len:189 (+),score=13.48 TRINITY_DN11785_c0_g1_i1:77-643(+)